MSTGTVKAVGRGVNTRVLAAFLLVAVGLGAGPAWGKKPSAAVVAKAFEGLESTNWKVRAKSIELLAKSGHPAAPKAIAALLVDEDATVRASACDALARIGDETVLRAVEDVARDSSPLVAERARVAGATIRKREGIAGLNDARRTNVEVTVNEDKTKSGVDGLTTALKDGVKLALGKNRKMTVVPGTLPGAGLSIRLAIQSFVMRKDGGDTVIEVTCAATVVEMPGSNLRFSTRIGAASSKGGKFSDEDKKELAMDAVAATATGLADEIVKWSAVRK